jgi:bis(5'-nucleosidyl)-tetraphosphatase
MNKEKSCGAVIYTIKNNRIYFLLSKMGLGHISLTKGHVEESESEKETAEREILEETSLKPEIDTNFRKVITYSPKEDVIKDVVFFVAKLKEEKRPKDLHDEEVVGFIWAEYPKAIKKLTFDSDKEVLKDAYVYILKKELNNGKF